MPCDVVVAGAGPAGTLAATMLARAGARVRLFDRAKFPRHKLCGDTLNPGALAVLSAHMSTTTITERGVPIDGMVLTGPGVEVRGAYPGEVRGRSLSRRDLDAILIDQAIEAGVEFEDEVAVTAPMSGETDRRVCGVELRTRRGTTCRHRAVMVVAADGRESRLARALGLARYRGGARRWAIGAYFDRVKGVTSCGEMHVRRGHYIGVSPLPDGIANACLVITETGDRRRWAQPADMLMRYVRADGRLGPRFALARMVDGPHVLGPLAVDTQAAGVPGLVLAGDAAGFIDPITGDGLRFALAGARLAAETVADVLAGQVSHDRAAPALAEQRKMLFAGKWRFNRAIRTLVAEPRGIAAAGVLARVMPQAFEAVIRYAGDCGGARERG